MENKQEIVIFKSSGNNQETEIYLDNNQATIWASVQQIASVFGRDRTVISRHIRNIFKDSELEESSVCAKIAHTAEDGKTYQVTQYNLDVIISVGYRVKSTLATEFRKWSTKVIKEHLVKGYSISNQIKEIQILELQNKLNNTEELLFQKQTQLTDGLLTIISSYSKSFELLNQYDTDELSTSDLQKDINYVINYKDVKKAIEKLKATLIKKGEASELFGSEKDDSFRGILGSISQTVFGELAYPTIEEQAAQLLYSIIKGHAFSDGNKRIGSFIFVWFLEQNNFHLKQNSQPKISDNTLVALALAVAQSIPDQRELIVKLIINIVKN